MTTPGTPTLDQLHVFLAVVEAKSFAAAARRLNRATSVVSYTVAALEAQLGLALFARAATARPTLTEAGHALLADARAVTRDIDVLRARVRGILDGLETEVVLAVDVILPTGQLTTALQAFTAEFPTVTLRLHVEALGAVTQLVLDRTAIIGISGPLDANTPGIERRPVATVAMITVAAPTHPLATLDPIPPGAAQDHVQLVLTDRSTLTAGRDFGVIGLRTWRLGDLGAKHALLRAGIGWGNMPAFMVEHDIAHGHLTRLFLPEIQSVAYPLSAIHRADTPPGPAAAWLIARLSQPSRLPS